MGALTEAAACPRDVRSASEPRWGTGGIRCRTGQCHGAGAGHRHHGGRHRQLHSGQGRDLHRGGCLLRHTGLDFTDIRHVYVAGGFGNYLDVRKAIRIGLLPDLPIEHFQFIGNGSLQGAKMVLLSRQALDVMEKRIAPNMTYFELSTDPQFMNEYTGSLFLPHTNIEKFPSVEKEQSEIPVR